MKPIISVENLSKRYRLGENRVAAPTFRETLTDSFKRSLEKRGKVENSFWALNDVSFTVNPGEVVGIIGRNGAGKSTLLKILSRITEPTKGKIELFGRVGSLLEVGTGFHPELTGRENIYLNGAILGMRQTEIAKKFDEIVEFAEVEKFLDTPVKHYSSGMYTRLAFAVAANLEPEILIVDEVLAVGDAEFQKKCLGKMKSVSDKEGRTVLFVSHNMTAVLSLCSRVIALENGRIKEIGNAVEVINGYLSKAAHQTLERSWQNLEEAPGTDGAKLKSVVLSPRFLPDSDVIDVRTPLDIRFEFEVLKRGQAANLSLHLYNLRGECVMNLGSDIKELQLGSAVGAVTIPGNFLNDDSYRISIMLIKDTSTLLFHLEEAISFTVEDYREKSAWHGKWEGAVRPTFIEFSLQHHICSRAISS